MRPMGLVLEEMGNGYASKMTDMKQKISNIVSLTIVQDKFYNILQLCNHARVFYLKILKIFCVYCLKDVFSSKTLIFFGR